METKNLLCLNDGRGTRVDVRTGTESALDLTLASHSLAAICCWDVIKESCIGSDHYPIMIEVALNLQHQDTGRAQGRSFSSAEWEKFRHISHKDIEQIHPSLDIDTLNQGCPNYGPRANCGPRSIFN